MRTINDVHQQFAEYFALPAIKPFAYFLSKRMSEGHICIDTSAIDIEEIPEQYSSLIDVHSLTQLSIVGSAAHDNQPFIVHKGKLYLQRYFRYETMLINRIAGFLQKEQNAFFDRRVALLGQKALIHQLFESNKTERVDWQLVAAITAVLNNFTIITGGPGTGKTTTVAKILALLFSMQPDTKIALAAPTGKAGARMAESLMNTQIDAPEIIKSNFSNLKPATIHRLLGWQKDSPYFRHNASNPLAVDLLIVDEASMIDAALFSKLLDAIAPHTRIILLGDKDQLASVEAGSLFGDLCRAQQNLNGFSKERVALINEFGIGASIALQEEGTLDDTHPLFEHIIELQYSHRFKGDEGIGRLSRAVINNDADTLQQLINNSNDKAVTIDQEYSTTIFNDFVNGYEEYIYEADILTALQKLNRLRVLCAVKAGSQGVLNVNAAVELYLSSKGLITRDGVFYNNRPVMVTRNDYTLGLYNGDIGILRPDKEGIMKAWFIDNTEANTSKLKSVLPGFITQMETVYAMTIHKSQGSEFDKVLVLLPDSPFKLLTRELLYTGITRAKSQVIIQGKAAVIMAAANAQVERGSGVIERLKSDI